MSANPRRIDVHHHLQPPKFIEYLNEHYPHWTGGPPIPNWSVPIAREVMERNGIAAAVASVVPSVYWGGDIKGAIKWATYCNEFSARVVHDDPRHFGALATLPLPDTKAACKELEYAMDQLGLDGVILWASNGNQYLGDPDFEELMAELNRRDAVVLIHPNTFPPGSDAFKTPVPFGLVEFMADTTRAVASLLFSGTLERYPRIRWIVSHAGAMVPYTAWRLQLGELMPPLDKAVPKGTLHYLRNLYYDTALSTSEFAFAALKEFAKPTNILFGSDYPLVPELVVQAEVKGLTSSKIMDAKMQKAIDRENALKLFPRFGADDNIFTRVARSLTSAA